MSNLGWYQILVELAKKVGGPKQLLALTFAAGGTVTAGTIAGGAAIKKKINLKKQELAEVTVYTFDSDYKINNGPLVKKGDCFKVIAKAGRWRLVEVLGDKNNPYFIDAYILSSISDYLYDLGGYIPPCIR